MIYKTRLVVSSHNIANFMISGVIQKQQHRPIMNMATLYDKTKDYAKAERVYLQAFAISLD